MPILSSKHHIRMAKPVNFMPKTITVRIYKDIYQLIKYTRENENLDT